MRPALGALLLAVSLAAAAMAGAANADSSPPPTLSGEPIGNTTRKTGTQSRQPEDGACNNPYGCARGRPQANQRPSDVYCQLNPDGSENRGPYRGTGKQIPCKKRADGTGNAESGGPRSQIVFNYFYINGINTPRDGVGRGTCLYDRGMINGNLLDQGPRVGPGLQVKPADAPSIKVGDEIDKFEIETCNPSGTEGKALRAVQSFCADTRAGKFAKSGPFTEDLAKLICIKAADIDRIRAQGLGGMSPGDVVEAFRQSLGLGFTDPKTGRPITGIEFTASQEEVAKVAGEIVKIYDREQAAARKLVQQAGASGAPAIASQRATAAEKNFFIILAHSQGNFFAEGVAYRMANGLAGESGKAAFQSRLGILSVASPTNYKSLEPGFLGRAVKHFTRADDGIRALDALAFLGSRVPWPAGDDLPALWPWKDEKTMRGSLELVRGQLDFSKPVYSPFFDTLGLAPPVEPCAGCGALYTPLMNSHLLDNYLTDPVAAKPNVAINRRAAPLFEGGKPMSQSAPPVLATIRTELIDLKKSLMGQH